MHHATDGLEAFGTRHLRVVIIGHEGVFATLHIHVVLFHAGQVVGVVANLHKLIFTATPERHVVVTARGRDPHERLGHEAGKNAVFAGHLRADLAIGCQTVRIAQHVVEHPVQLQLTRRVLMVALDHVETHFAGVSDHLHGHRAQAFELVDVVAIRLGEAIARLAVLIELQPHHLRLRADAQLGAMLFGEFIVQTAQVPPAVRRKICTRIHLLFAVAEKRTEETANLRRPRQLHECFRLRDTDQFRRLRAIAQIVACPVGKEVHRRAIDQLEALLGHAFPVVSRDALTHDLAGDRNELQIEIFNPHLVNHLAHLLDLFVPSRGLHKLFNIHGHVVLPDVPKRAL